MSVRPQRATVTDIRARRAERKRQEIVRVAAALGFADVSVLVRAFTRGTGESPSEHRARKAR